MAQMDYFVSFYSPGPDAAPGTYSADHFRENLEELLERLNLTQAEAAKKCDVTPAVMWTWIAGKCEPNLYSFVRICAGLGVEPNWLLAKHIPIKKNKKEGQR